MKTSRQEDHKSFTYAISQTVGFSERNLLYSGSYQRRRTLVSLYS